VELTTKQTEAVETAVKSRRCIITGGAGSGKTTVIRNIIERIAEEDSDECIVLCAPTGKAAARVREATGYKAITVHSACGAFPVDGEDEIGKNPNPSPASVATTVIVDEASMLDDQILACLCKELPHHCRLVLVGDPNQLAPVGAGYPFRDLIASGKVPHVHLDVCHRQAGKLLHNCYSILEGESDAVVYDAGKGARHDADWSVIECSDDAIISTLAKLYTGDNCNELLGIDAEEILVLTPLNKGPWGRVELNRLIQKTYHESHNRVAPQYKATDFQDQFVVGDRVIWTENDRILGLVNGDTGRVVAVGNNQVTVDWDGIGQKVVDNGSKLQLAWVLTCHKSQGSQYRKVLVIQSSKHCNTFLSGIVNRSWVYTAATRSKEATFFLGSAKAFRQHVATKSVDRRDTYLSQLVA